MSILFWTYGVTGKFYLRLSLFHLIISSFCRVRLSRCFGRPNGGNAARVSSLPFAKVSSLSVAASLFIKSFAKPSSLLRFHYHSLVVIFSTDPLLHLLKPAFPSAAFLLHVHFLLFLCSLCRPRCYYYILLRLCLVLIHCVKETSSFDSALRSLFAPQ